MIKIYLHTLATLAAVLLLTTGNHVFADQGDLTFESGQSKVALLELYTSEGCSGSPPGEGR